MYDSSMIMMLATLTAAHPGSGTELSYVDLPIQREIHTGFPKIEASTLKGCIRNMAVCKKTAESVDIDRIFGASDSGHYASAAAFTDASLLFFPVKAVAGVFAWITCPLAIGRFLEACKVALGLCEDESQELTGIVTEYGVKLNDKEAVAAPGVCPLAMKIRGIDQIMLEDYTFRVRREDSFGVFLEWIEDHLPDSEIIKSRFRAHTIMVSDSVFTDFVEHSTEVNARIKVDSKTGTVDGTALFTEEYLPSDCILYDMIFFSGTHISQDEADNVERWTAAEVLTRFKQLFTDDIFQIGADSTLGKGLVMKRFWEKGES